MSDFDTHLDVNVEFDEEKRPRDAKANKTMGDGLRSERSRLQQSQSWSTRHLNEAQKRQRAHTRPKLAGVGYFSLSHSL